jgi:predicted porin
MRKLARTLAAALPAAVLPGVAALAAEPLSVAVGGYANAGVGYASALADGGDGFGVFRDGEIHFAVERSSDNGLTFFGEVELEAFTDDDRIDENCFGARGAFGAIFFGGCDTALNEVGGVGVVKPSGSYLNYYDDDGGVMPGYPGGFIGEDDAVGGHYVSPTIAGFTVGATYQPDPDTDGGDDANGLVVPPDGADDANQFAIGASFVREFDGIGFAIGGGYLGNESLDQWHLGAEIGYAGFTVAGFYNTSDEDPAIGGEQEDTWAVGAMYETGPWSFGGGYARQDLDDAGVDERNFVHVGGGYDLAPGVTTYAAVQWGEDDPGEEGVGVFAWLNLRF